MLVLRAMYQPGYELKKAGVIVSGIIPADQVQGSLFDRTDRKKLNRADAVMDKINHFYGRNTVKLAAQGFSKKWKLNNNYLSRRFTTNWNELMEIR